MLSERRQYGCIHSLRKDITMKNIRQYISCMFTSLLLICIMQIHIIYAAAIPSLSASADAADVEAGDYVNISIQLSENPSVSTLGAALSYDSSVLKYDSASWNSSFSGSDMKMASDTGSEINLSVVCDSSYSADGTIATVRFQAVSDSSSIPVTLSLRDMADADLSEVPDCRVSSQVLVPKTSREEKDTENTKTDAVEVKAPKSGQDTGKSEKIASENPAADTASADGESARSVSIMDAGSTQEMSVSASSTVKSTPVQNASTASSSNTGRSKLDQNYKTGAGIGSDMLLVIAAACGIFALGLAVRKRGEEKK